LHYWVFGGPWHYGGERGLPAEVDRAYMEGVFSSGGALVCGRTMYDVVGGWGEDPGFGVPVFVVTHRPHEAVVKGDTRFEFVTGGIHEALARARAAADERAVILMGGGDLIRQFLTSGLLDVLTLTLAPVLLGSGKRLFDGMTSEIAFERAEVVESPHATHLRFRVGR
jgi:dihydrofolate reductase